MDIEPENTLGDSTGRPLTLEDIDKAIEKIRESYGMPNEVYLFMTIEEVEALKVFINTHGGKI